MQDIGKRPADKLEENNASATLKSHLKGKPIVQTSGDAEHQLSPTEISISVRPSEKGEVLCLHITQQDRHHPHLMYDTLKNELAKLPEFQDHKPKELDPKHDYDAHTGKVVISYELPSGIADTIIHSLSLRAPAKNSWVEKVETPVKQIASQGENWLDNIINKVRDHFSKGNGRA